MNRNFVIAIALLALAGCSASNSSSDGSTTTPSVSNALTTAKNKITALVPDTSSVGTSSVSIQASINTEWTDSNKALGGDFGNSPRNFIRNHGDSTAQSSLMFRLGQVLENLCLFSTALPSTDGIPDLTAGSTVTLTSTLKATMASKCDVSVSDLPPDNTVVGFNVVDISSNSGTQYDRKVGFDMSGGSSYTSFFYFRLTSAITRFSYMENSTNKSIAIFEYDPSSKISRFEFSESATASNFKLHYRGVLNESTNYGRFIAFVKKTDVSDTATAVVSTKEGEDGTMSISYSFDDNANTHDFTDGNACVSPSTFSITTDNTLTCGTITGATASSFTADPGTGVTDAYVTATDETTFIQFTSLSDILTAGLAQ